MELLGFGKQGMCFGWDNENFETKVLRFAGKMLEDLLQVVANSPLATIYAYGYDANIQVCAILTGTIRKAHDPIFLWTGAFSL
jgi:hypothetical protein